MPYDVFLSYNSQDHTAVEEIARKLHERGIRCFLDRWYLPKGQPWRSLLEQTLAETHAVAVFIGPQGMGPWQHREIDVALDLQSRNGSFPVIPVLLPGCEPPLGFLRQNTWIDRRNQPLDQVIFLLEKSIRGDAPGPDLEAQFAEAKSVVCPYRGLLYFREEDAPFFFGRNAAIEELCKAVTRTSFVAVVGASGSGKSSVVRAGLVPRLRKERSTTWEIISLVPGDEPLKSLAGAIVPLLYPELDPIDRREKVNKLAAKFGEGSISLRDMVRDVLERQPGTQRLLLIGDQWEELYTLTKDETQRRRFIDEVMDATARAPLTVVLTLRGDFIGKALAYRPLSDRLQDAQVNLGPMTIEELKCAVRLPARDVGLAFEAGLDARILADVGDEPGHLPLLEFVLRELWEKRQAAHLLHSAYEQIGGLQGAVAAKAEGLYENLSPPEQEATRRLFLQLVHTAEEGKDTRRREKLDDIPESSRELVKKMADERLLITGGSASGGESVEVAHEALIRNWSRLVGWLNKDREFLLWRERLRALFDEWEHSGRSDELLLRGPVLGEAEGWILRGDGISEEQREFIVTSVGARQQRQDAARLLQQRELEGAQRLAEARKLATSNLKKGLVVAVLLLLLAIASTVTAIVARYRAEAARRDAEISQAEGLLSEGNALSLAARWADAKDRYLKARSKYQELGVTTYNADVALSKVYQFSAPPLLEFAGADCPTDAVVGISKDGLVLAGVSTQSENESAESPQYHGTLTVWNVMTGQKIKTYGTCKSGAEALSVDKSGSRAVLAIPAWVNEGGGGHITSDLELWDLNAGKQLKKWKEQGAGIDLSVAISPNGAYAAGPGPFLRALESDDAPLELTGQRYQPSGFVFTSDSKVLATSNADGSIKVWDTSLKKATGVLVTNLGQVKCMTLTPDDKVLVAGSASGSIGLWSLADGREVGRLHGHDNSVTSVAVAPNGSFLVSGSEDATVRVWNLLTERETAALTGHQGVIESLCFTTPEVAVSGARDGLKSWRIKEGAEVRIGKGHTGIVDRVSLSPDGRMAVSAGIDHSCRLWDVATGKQLKVISEFPQMVTSACFSKDGRRVLAVSGEKMVLLDIATGEKKWEVKVSEYLCLDAVFGRDETCVVTGGVDGVSAWNSETGALIRKFDSPPASKPRISPVYDINAVSWLPNSNLVVGAARDTLHLWDGRTGQHLRAFWCDGHNIQSLAVSMDGNVFASGGYDKTVRLWDPRTGENSMVLKGHTGGVEGLSFMSDPNILASAGDDGTIRLWDINKGRELHALSGHQDFVRGICFSPDGYMLVSGSGDKTLRFWDFARSATYLAFQPRLKDAQAKLARNPTDVDAISTLGEWYSFRGLYDWAATNLEQAEAAKKNVSTLELARCYWHLGRFADAAAKFQELVSRAKDPAEALYLRLCLAAVTPPAE